jgi:hypothetical protein
VNHSNWLITLSNVDVFTAAIVSEITRRAAILQLALALFEVRHGRPAAALIDLVPEILPELPLDPYSGQSFCYRVSAGEEMPWFGNNPDGSQQTTKVAPGQGVIWSVGPDLHNDGGIKPGTIFWRTTENQADVVFLVPLVKKP